MAAEGLEVVGTGEGNEVYEPRHRTISDEAVQFNGFQTTVQLPLEIPSRWAPRGTPQSKDHLKKNSFKPFT